MCTVYIYYVYVTLDHNGIPDDAMMYKSQFRKIDT